MPDQCMNPQVALLSGNKVPIPIHQHLRLSTIHHKQQCHIHLRSHAHHCYHAPPTNVTSPSYPPSPPHQDHTHHNQQTHQKTAHHHPLLSRQSPSTKHQAHPCPLPISPPNIPLKTHKPSRFPTAETDERTDSAVLCHKLSSRTRRTLLQRSKVEIANDWGE